MCVCYKILSFSRYLLSEWPYLGCFSCRWASSNLVSNCHIHLNFVKKFLLLGKCPESYGENEYEGHAGGEPHNFFREVPYYIEKLKASVYHSVQPVALVILDQLWDCWLFGLLSIELLLVLNK